jgi:hypothetical protein
LTLFFLVVGLEAKRERDLGELREGARLTVPVLAPLAGMAALRRRVSRRDGRLGRHGRRRVGRGDLDRHRGQLLASAVTSPVTWGIILAYVIGKPLGIVIAASVASKGASRRATALLAPALAAAALAPRRYGAAPMCRISRVPVTSACLAR